jgi:hypothetical protein
VKDVKGVWSGIIWFQPYVQAGRGSLLEHVFLSAARLRRGVPTGVKVQSSEFRFSCTTYTITVCIRLGFSFTQLVVRS